MKKTKSKKYHQGAWFRKVRGSYLPATWQGWLTYIPFVMLLLWSGAVIYFYVNSLALFVIFLIVVWATITIVMSWIASKKS